MVPGCLKPQAVSKGDVDIAPMGACDVPAFPPQRRRTVPAIRAGSLLPAYSSSCTCLHSCWQVWCTITPTRAASLPKSSWSSPVSPGWPPAGPPARVLAARLPRAVALFFMCRQLTTSGRAPVAAPSAVAGKASRVNLAPAIVRLGPQMAADALGLDSGTKLDSPMDDLIPITANGCPAKCEKKQ